MTGIVVSYAIAFAIGFYWDEIAEAAGSFWSGFRSGFNRGWNS